MDTQLDTHLVNSLRAFFYMHLSEPMPEPAVDIFGQIDTEADNERLRRWSEESIDFMTTQEEVESFVTRLLELLNNLQQLNDDTPPADIMTLFYDAAKAAFGEEGRSIRRFFILLYLVILQTDSGPRWGEFVSVYGIPNFVDLVFERLHEICEGRM